MAPCCARITGWRSPIRPSAVSTPGTKLGREGARLAEQVASPGQVRWFKGVLSDHHYRRGEWDVALRMADEFLAWVESGSPHYNACQDWAIRS